MPTPDKEDELAEEAKEIMEDPDEIPDDDMLAGTESYDESDAEAESEGMDSEDDPQELDFDPAGDDLTEVADTADAAEPDAA